MTEFTVRISRRRPEEVDVLEASWPCDEGSEERLVDAVLERDVYMVPAEHGWCDYAADTRENGAVIFTIIAADEDAAKAMAVEALPEYVAAFDRIA